MAYERVQKTFGQSSSKKKHTPIVPPLNEEPTQAGSQLSPKLKPSRIPSSEEREAIKRKIFDSISRSGENQAMREGLFSPTVRVQNTPDSASAIGMPIQPKLTIGAPGDKYELEADRVAAQVVNLLNAPVAQQSHENQEREEMSVEEEELQMKPMVQLQPGAGGMTATPEVETSIQQARGGGHSLADNIREPMEQAFGADFSGVKVHTDAQADQLNQSIQAKAFTTGQDVFFRQAEYNPGSRGGQELIAHELTHVVQQNGGAVQRSTLTLQMMLEESENKGVFRDDKYPNLVFTLDNKETDELGENVYSVTGTGLKNPTRVTCEANVAYSDIDNDWKTWEPLMEGETVKPTLKKKLNDIAKKYGGKSGERCHECATEMQDAFKREEIVSEVYDIGASDDSHIMVMGARVRNHYVNVVDKIAYDASTGGKGVLWENYFKALGSANKELTLTFNKVG